MLLLPDILQTFSLNKQLHSKLNFLGIKISILGDGLPISSLYCKPTAARQYLHWESYR